MLMTTREKRPATRTLRGCAIAVLQEVLSGTANKGLKIIARTLLRGALRRGTASAGRVKSACMSVAS
jgi:hypothetical protein